MEKYNEHSICHELITASQPQLTYTSHNVTSAGQSAVHNTGCLPVTSLLPRTRLPDPEIPDIAAMDDGQRRLWLASRCDPVADQLPQARRTLDGRPPGDLQPGTQRNRAACADAARPGPESVAPAGDVALLPRSADRLFTTVGAQRGATFSAVGTVNETALFTTVGSQNVGLRSTLYDDIITEDDMDVDNSDDEAEAEAVEALLTLQKLKFSGRLSASKQVSALAKPLGLVVQSPRLPRSLPMCDFDTGNESVLIVANNQNIDSEVMEAVSARDTGSRNAREPVNNGEVNAVNTRRRAVDDASDTCLRGPLRPLVS